MGSAVIFRHYDDPNRQEIYKDVAQICRRRGHRLVVAGDQNLTRLWKADGLYQGRPTNIRPRNILVKQSGFINIMGVHTINELHQAKRLQADMIFISPLYATRSHKGKRALGIMMFQRLALLGRKQGIAVMALGGMDRKRATMIAYIYGYGAIDGLIG